MLEKVKTGWNFTAYPLDLRIIQELAGLDKLDELHDRIIVATARILNAQLITKDDGIKGSEYVEVIW